MDFCYAETFPGSPEADGYERLLHDAMIGDATLFIRTDEVEQAWQIVDPFLEAWSEDGRASGALPGGDLGPPRGRPPAWRGPATAGASRRHEPPSGAAP